MGARRKRKERQEGQDARAQERARFDEAARKARGAREANREIRERLRDDTALQERVRRDLIADLRRVYEHPDNPYRGFAASRKRYRQLGHFPEILVSDFFGNHAEFLRAAGLADKRNTTRARNKAAQLHTHQRIAEFARSNVLRYCGRFEKARGRRKHLEVVAGSDFHSFFCDPFALEVFVDVVGMVQPDVVALVGDVVDFPQFSRHRKLPGHFHLNAYEETQLARRRILARVRKAAPDAQIDFVVGNHEYRLVTYLADTAPELACFPSMDFDEVFGLTELEINLVCRSSFLAPSRKARKKDVRENWVVYGDCYALTHGTFFGKFSAAAQLETYKMSGASGHVHRPQLHTDNSVGTGPLSWMSLPMMAHPAVGSDYMPEPSRWNGGFGHAAILPGRGRRGLVSQEPVIVHLDWCSWAGKTWVPTAAAERARAKIRAV